MHLPPFDREGTWYKGNLHTHTTQSDGALSLSEALDWYRAHGYDFLAVTDHWIWTPTELRDDGLLVVSGIELGSRDWHIVGIGGAQPPETVLGEANAIFDHFDSSGGVAVLAHPYWSGIPSHRIAQWHVSVMEVYNASCENVQGLGCSRVHWDERLQEGARIWGVAVDDVHWRDGAEGKGYVMVHAASLTEEAIVAALRAGHFYASTGPAIHDLFLDTGEDGRLFLNVSCSPCSMITFHAAGPRGRRFIAPSGETLTSARLEVKPEQVYVRVECQDAAGGIAWTNPVFCANLFT